MADEYWYSRQLNTYSKRKDFIKRFQTLPKELRLEILAYACHPRVFEHLEGLEIDLLPTWFPEQLHHEANEAVYGTKELIFDLGYRANFNDIDDESSSINLFLFDIGMPQCLSFIPGFMADMALLECACRRIHFVEMEIFRCFPLYVFKKITIRIPPPTFDPIGFMLSWSRLRFIGGLLGNSVRGLPHIEIDFLDKASWVENGRFIVNGPELCKMFKLGKEQSTCDVLLLLRALVRLRGAASIEIKTPFPEQSTNSQFSIGWLKNSMMQTTPYGEYMDIEWDDAKSEF